MIKTVCFIVLLTFHCGVSAQVLPDPTRPQESNSAARSIGQVDALLLSAIFISEQSKQAIINNKSFIEGQVIQGFTIFSIAKNRVELRGPEGHKILQLINNDIKKDANDDF
jgi:hypothetical protein